MMDRLQRSMTDRVLWLAPTNQQWRVQHDGAQAAQLFFSQRLTVAYNRCHATGNTRDCAASASHDGSHPKVEITRFEKRTPRPRHRGVRNTDDMSDRQWTSLKDHEEGRSTIQHSGGPSRWPSSQRWDSRKTRSKTRPKTLQSKDSTETFFRTETLSYTRTLFCVDFFPNLPSPCPKRSRPPKRTRSRKCKSLEAWACLRSLSSLRWDQTKTCPSTSLSSLRWDQTKI